MQNAYNSHAKTVGELLGPNEAARIVVPQFQRGYSWEKKHVEAFWPDVIRHQRESHVKGGPDKYFLGPVVTLFESKDIIQLRDSQERLATATIWFSVIRDIARALSNETGTDTGKDLARDIQRDVIAKDEAGFALRLGEMDNLYFSETVQTDPPIVKTPTLKSHRSIQRAQLFLRESTVSLLGNVNPKNARNLSRP